MTYLCLSLGYLRKVKRSRVRMENSCGLYLDTEEEKEMFFRISKLLYRLMAIFLFLCAEAFSGAAEAGVTLVPNDRGGPNPTSGDYVYLGTIRIAWVSLMFMGITTTKTPPLQCSGG